MNRNYLRFVPPNRIGNNPNNNANNNNEETANIDEKWSEEDLRIAHHLLKELDTLRSDRAVVFLDLARTKQLLGHLLRLCLANEGVHSVLRTTRQPPLLNTLLWTGGDSFQLSDLDAWRNLLGPQPLQEQLVRRCNKTGHLPIHVACLASTHEVIMRLVTWRPHLLQRRDSKGRLPFQLAMSNTRHPPSFKIWKRLLQLYPQAYEHCFCRTMTNSLDFLEAYVRWFPISERTLLLEEVNPAEPPLSLEHSKVLCKLLPQLDTLQSSYAPGWNKEAILHLLKSLEGNTSLEELAGIQLPSLAQEPDATLHAFQKMIETTSSLKKVKLTCREELSQLLPWLQSLKAGLLNPSSPFRPTKDVSLEVLPTANNTNNNPDNIDIDIHQEVPRHTIWLEAKLPRGDEISICIKGHSLADPSVCHILQQIGALLPIYGFKVQGRHFPPENLYRSTQPMADVLQSIGPSLQTLSIHGLDVHIPTILQALQSTPHLRSLDYAGDSGMAKLQRDAIASGILDLLQETHMQWIKCKPWGSSQPKIQYYLHLNRVGRQQVRNTESRTVLVQLLQKVMDDGFWEAHEPDKARHGALYGLLREVPAIWCLGGGGSAAGGGSDKKEKETTTTTTMTCKRKKPPM